MDVVTNIDEINHSTDMDDFEPIAIAKVTGKKNQKNGLSYKKPITSKNSKFGCLDCKKRKIKCDESFPICMYCEKRNIRCAYLTMTPFQVNQIMLSKKYKNNNSFNNTNLVFSTIKNKFQDYESNQNNKKFNFEDYKYHEIKEINLRSENNTSIISETSVYKAHEIEGLILPMGQKVSTSSYYRPVIYDYKNLYTDKSSFAEPLYQNSRVVDRRIQLNRRFEVDYVSEFAEKSYQITQCLATYDFQKLLRIIGYDKHIDIEIKIDYFKTLNIAQIYSKLLRKSLILKSLDYHKNILLNQPILRLTDYETKLLISHKCEIESLISIDNITNIIKNEYLPIYDEFVLSKVDLLTGCFLVLNYCLVFHFKNGLRFEISKTDSEKSIGLLGIFSTGLYSIVMGKSRQDLLLTGSNILSAHLINDFKRALIQGLDIDLLVDLKKNFDKLNLKYLNNVDYENLHYFLEKNVDQLKENVAGNTILGFNNDFLIRILNDFISVIPYRFGNVRVDHFRSLIENNHTINVDYEILIHLFYYAASQILQAIVPSVTMFANAHFSAVGWEFYELHVIKNLIEIGKLISDKKLKVVGIYLIRIIAFLIKRASLYKKHFNELDIKFLFENDLSLEEKYEQLLKMKREKIYDEIHIKSLSLVKGQFIREWNYPNKFNLKPERNFKISENKISSAFASEDEIINDFFENNSGFLKFDYCGMDYGKSVVEEIEFINGIEMRKLWKMVVYIRINNL